MEITIIALLAVAMVLIVRRECRRVTTAEQAAERQMINEKNRKLWALRANQTTDWRD